MQAMRALYEAMAAPAKLVFRGAAWRLPDWIVRERIVEPFLKLCREHGMVAKHCKPDLLTCGAPKMTSSGANA